MKFLRKPSSVTAPEPSLPPPPVRCGHPRRRVLCPCRRQVERHPVDPRHPGGRFALVLWRQGLHQLAGGLRSQGLPPCVVRRRPHPTDPCAARDLCGPQAAVRPPVGDEPVYEEPGLPLSPGPPATGALLPGGGGGRCRGDASPPRHQI